jgi:hypothetical protein
VESNVELPKQGALALDGSRVRTLPRQKPNAGHPRVSALRKNRRSTEGRCKAVGAVDASDVAHTEEKQMKIKDYLATGDVDDMSTEEIARELLGSGVELSAADLAQCKKLDAAGVYIAPLNKIATTLDGNNNPSGPGAGGPGGGSGLQSAAYESGNKVG